MSSIVESDVDEEEEKYMYDTIFKMKCNRCHNGYPLEELSMCQHPKCTNNKSIYCLTCGDRQHEESKISHQFCSRYEDTSQSTSTNLNSAHSEYKNQNNTDTTEQKMELKMDISLESRLNSNVAALDKLNILQIQCEICLEKYDINNVYICQHKDCDNDGRIICQKCGDYVHERKTHKFNSDGEYITCVQALVKPDPKEYKYDVDQADDAIRRQRSNCSYLNSFSIIPLGFVEQAFVWREWYRGKISLSEALKYGAISLISHCAATAAFVGSIAFGAAIGSPGGPVGAIVGAIAAAIFFSLATRYGIHKGIEYYKKRENEARKKLVKDALLYFFGDENYDINDANKFNVKILSKQYRKLAFRTHPDKNNGDQTEWLKLCSYYGILTAVYEQHTNQSDELDNITVGQITLIGSALIKENARLIDTISANHSLASSSSDMDSSYGNTLSSVCTEHSHLSTESQEFCLNL